MQYKIKIFGKNPKIHVKEILDVNASLNLSFDLPSISKTERLKHKNRTGFYWNVSNQQSIVADALIA